MKIQSVKVTNLRFSREPDTLKKNLCTPVSKFKDPADAGRAWFGPVALALVEVEADNGLVGYGTVGGFTSVGKELIDTYLADLVIGHSPFDVEYLYDRMTRATVRFGRRGAVVAAISAIDIACWDLMGKCLKQPVYNLLGGKTKPKVRAYASRLYALEDLDRLAEEAKGYVAEGFTALKQRFGFGPADGYEGMCRNVELIKTVREAVGDCIELAADAYMGWDYAYALEIERRLRPYNLSWIEEPFLPDDFASYAKFHQRSQTRVSCGEHEYTLAGFKRLMEADAADIIQPDTNRVGGITAMKKICALAEAYELPIYPHSNEAHNFHVILSQQNCPLVEYFPNVEPDTGNELFWKVFEGEPTIQNGYLEASEKPGLGIEVNREAVEALRWDGD